MSEEQKEPEIQGFGAECFSVKGPEIVALKTVKLRFIVDTPMDMHHVIRGHCGRLQPGGDDPDNPGKIKFHFPAGTVIEAVDFVASGVAEIVE